MILTLALRNITHRPWRSVLLFVGYGMGVTVMIVLLSIGEALLVQGRDERLVGGGAITVLPEGLDVEVMKTGGLGGLFFSIDHARFVYHQLLAAPRLAAAVTTVAPQIEGKLLYLRAATGEYAVRSSGEIPSAGRGVGAAPVLAGGRWVDDEDDRRWMRPTPAELRADIDHFHLTPSDMAHPESWAEWHYFNVLSRDGKRWAFVSFIVAGEVPGGRWGGQVLVTLREQGGVTRRFTAVVRPRDVRLSTDEADLTLGRSSVSVRADGAYVVSASAREEPGGAPVTVDLVVSPAPSAYFPGAEVAGGELVSGYTVPALRADASGEICVSGRCERFEGAQSYHDHNWGGWRGVTWEWGAARAGAFTLLYGRVAPPVLAAPADSAARASPAATAHLDADSARSSVDRSRVGNAESSVPLFVYLVDSLGFRAVFRPRRITYEDARVIRVDGRDVRVPARAVMADARGDDTLRIELEIEDAIGTDTRRDLIGRGEAGEARALARPYFIQMKGRARVSGRVGGEPVAGSGAGFFETYR